MQTLDHTQRRYQEKKLLLNSHMRTEEALTDQAKELLSVAQDASNETYSLHETLERRRRTDAQIKETCNQFGQTMNNNLDGMAALIENFTEDYKKQAKKILKQLSKWSFLYEMSVRSFKKY